jgi:hypothetical protein
MSTKLNIVFFIILLFDYGNCVRRVGDRRLIASYNVDGPREGSRNSCERCHCNQRAFSKHGKPNCATLRKVILEEHPQIWFQICASLEAIYMITGSFSGNQQA